MTQAEGPAEPEIVETDLSQEEGMPTERGSTLAGDGLTQVEEGSLPEAGSGNGRLADVSFFFRVPGMAVRMRNRSADSSPTNRSLAASLLIAVSGMAALVFGRLFLGAVDSTVVLAGALLIVAAGFYLALRLTSAPAMRKPRTRSHSRRSRRRGDDRA